MSEEEKPHNHMRKSTKIGIGLGAVFLALPQLKSLKEFLLDDQIVTNQRIEATMKEGFARLEGQISKHVEDEVIARRRIRDLGREELTASENRCEKRTDKVESRVENLELYAFKLTARKGITN